MSPLRKSLARSMPWPDSERLADGVVETAEVLAVGADRGERIDALFRVGARLAVLGGRSLWNVLPPPCWPGRAWRRYTAVAGAGVLSVDEGLWPCRYELSRSCSGCCAVFWLTALTSWSPCCRTGLGLLPVLLVLCWPRRRGWLRRRRPVVVGLLLLVGGLGLPDAGGGGAGESRNGRSNGQDGRVADHSLQFTI